MIFYRRYHEVEASQWRKNGDHPKDYEHSIINFNGPDISPQERREKNWEGDVVRYYRRPKSSMNSVCNQCKHPMHNHGWIDPSTNNGREVVVCPGDWILTQDDGSYTRMPTTQFFANYSSSRVDAFPSKTGE